MIKIRRKFLRILLLKFAVKCPKTLWSFICVEIILRVGSAFRRNAIFRTFMVLQISILRID